ncbi:putative nucleotidyltransferase substrate binding domain-containing protein [Hydrogenimonas thermophila]|uniref:CBS domain-containing protein n=1 Tax=Hydrogenimonas thermophila TaxID=223786 RepID=A0A1I5M0X5_9BACT|nr:putative nucleotidyltransferase substrate binding domain-containing protein [Hydrogenimonas thermophila]WOE70514.1 putative nucleotidyltransferase substrate binding domain-containing protein [Hydrogenimonas thermophila]WOE73030.1 putative nucleotidyltransferase substrate binding domain-containing protein [Hydrogenimonas thermophila]SFP02676.1 CBS domain-containing protein [Hydrogenimonas thermophila]
MSIVEQKSFLISIHPFDSLSDNELERVLSAMDIAYYPKDTILFNEDKKPDNISIIIKGSVEASDKEGNVEYFGALDTIGACEILQHSNERIYRVIEELLCYEIPKTLFLELIKTNDAFKTFYLEDIATRLQALRKQSQQTEFTEFLTARIGDIFIHSPYIVEGTTPIVKAVAGMEAVKATAILVKHQQHIGIVTDSDLRHHIILGGVSLQEPIANIATYKLITIERDDFLFNALLMMTRHSIKRLVVTHNKNICGTIEQIDLLSYFSNHAYLLSVQIEKASSIEELKSTTDGMVNIVRTLHHKGIKARYIARIISELNAKVFAKVFELIIPQEWHSNVALMVMGSEGREEQIIRTDQDNGLIIKDDFYADGLEGKMTQFSKALQSLGFPECPGNVMVSNPEWSQPLQDFKKAIDNWVDIPESDAMMKLAILVDAKCVAGNTKLLKDLRHYLFNKISNHPTALAIFAQAVERFDIPLGLLGGFGNDQIDLKKGGSFILMHGIRALALEQKIEVTSTVERIKELNEIGLIDRKFATELIESFDVILTFILQNKLSQIAQGKKPDNRVDIRNLSKLERDMLKDALKVVRELKKFITYHFKLNMVG